MTEVAAWLRSERRRQAARPELLSALLSGGGLAYARHRLGFMAVRMLLRTGIHAIEIQLLIAAFVPWELLAPLITYRIVCGLLGAAHWGALEPLRTSVREAARRRRPESVRASVEAWLGLTLWAAVTVIVIVVGAETAAAVSSGAIDLRAAYALACVLRLATDSGVRALHSGVFAVRRVHRPLWSTLCPDLCELATIAIGFGDLGVWSIPLATWVGGTCDAVLAYVFVRRAYGQRGLPLPSTLRALRSAGRLPTGGLGSAARHALANLSLQLDGLVLLSLVQAGDGARDAMAFTALYYVLRPLMAAATAWVRTFYFDLKLIEKGALRAFRPQLLRFLEGLAVAWALLLSATTLGLSVFLLGDEASFELLVLLPFFVTRSAFALLQIIAFGAGDLRRLVQMGGLVVAGLCAFRLLEFEGTTLLAAIAVLLALGVVFARRQMRERDAAVYPGVLDLRAWLHRLRTSSATRLCVLQVHSQCGRVGAVVRGLRGAHPKAAIVRWGRRYVVMALDDADPIDTRALIVTCGGTLRHVWVSPAAPPVALLGLALDARALPESFREGLRRISDAPPLIELERDFRAQFAAGEVCDLGSGRGIRSRSISASDLRALISSVEARSRGREAFSERSLPFQIAVYAPCGLARTLFIADAGAPGFDAFRREVHDASLHASWPEVFQASGGYWIERASGVSRAYATPPP